MIFLICSGKLLLYITFRTTQQTRDVDPMLVQCWSIVYDAGPTLNQHWVDGSCLLGNSHLTLSSLTLHCHLHPLQAANCCRNSRLAVDEDDLKWVVNEKKCYY